MVNMITALCGYFSGTFVSDTGGTFKSDTPGTFVSDIGGTFEVILSPVLPDMAFAGFEIFVFVAFFVQHLAIVCVCLIQKVFVADGNPV